jgi:GNAT superfamily N-acetyltransferase
VAGKDGRGVSLRPERDDDLDFLCGLYGSTRADELAQVPWSDEEKQRFVRFQFDAQRRFYREQYPSATFEVIEVDGAPAGRLYVVEWPAEIRLMDVALLPTRRGRGVGTTLLRDLQARGEAAGKPLTIHVERFNPALRLYQRLGFRAIEDKGVYLLLEWRSPRSPAAQGAPATSEGGCVPARREPEPD